MEQRFVYDDEAWYFTHPDDLWVYDKLIVSRKLGYLCGPTGINVSQPSLYVVRPITNVRGMGQQAELKVLHNTTDHLPLGHFWCEIFNGRHLSVDYVTGVQVLCVEGTRRQYTDLTTWDKWQRVPDKVPYPSLLTSLVGEYKRINCEFIGGHLIEIHLRGNPDFDEHDQVIYPVWEGDEINPPEGFEFVEAPDHTRLGFYKAIKINT